MKENTFVDIQGPMSSQIVTEVFPRTRRNFLHILEYAGGICYKYMFSHGTPVCGEMRPRFKGSDVPLDRLDSVRYVWRRQQTEGDLR